MSETPVPHLKALLFSSDLPPVVLGQCHSRLLSPSSTYLTTPYPTPSLCHGKKPETGVSGGLRQSLGRVPLPTYDQ